MSISSELRSNLSSIIISDEFSWVIAYKTGCTSSEALVFIKNNIDTIINTIVSTGVPATLVIPALINA